MNVRFFRLDRLKVEQALRRYAESLAENPRVLAVVLFGSLARGDATAMSDADMMIILSDACEPFHTRISAFLRPGMGIAMDVFPYTLAEALQALREGWGVVPVAGPAKGVGWWIRRLYVNGYSGQFLRWWTLIRVITWEGT